MSLTALDLIVLWGPPVVIILFAIGYYMWWGKENEESRKPTCGGEA
ncbi:hypothetical protein [Halarchaeum acidiphilum]|nr:hypothetical protein [Halarchaeum acidiphilum]